MVVYIVSDSIEFMKVGPRSLKDGVSLLCFMNYLSVPNERFPTVTLICCNYYYQHPYSGSTLCLKVSKEEEAYLKANQHRSKMGVKPEMSFCDKNVSAKHICKSFAILTVGLTDFQELKISHW